jgi:hypothetical protein
LRAADEGGGAVCCSFFRRAGGVAQAAGGAVSVRESEELVSVCTSGKKINLRNLLAIRSLRSF